jgi:hypothetical protein
MCACRKYRSPISRKPGWPWCARPSLNKHHKIGREELSVREHMGIILRLLQERGGFVQFETMFDPGMGAPGLVVHFLAMLELAREKLVEFTQSEAFEPIYVRVHQGGGEASLVKKVLEAALLAAREPLTPLELRKMFDEDLSTDVLRKLLDELREEWAERRSS